MVIKARLVQALADSDKTQADLARFTNVSTAGVNLWFKDDGKNKIVLKHENLVKVALCLGVSTDWLTGKSSARNAVSNMELLSAYSNEDHVLISVFEQPAVAQLNDSSKPVPNYIRFDTSWLKDKGYSVENLRMVYIHGDSMRNQISSGDFVLVRTDRKKLVDGCIFAFNYGGVARLKRVFQRANGGFLLVTDNDPDGAHREEVPLENLEQLNLIGQAVWGGGDLS